MVSTGTILDEIGLSSALRERSCVSQTRVMDERTLLGAETGDSGARFSFLMKWSYIRAEDYYETMCVNS